MGKYCVDVIALKKIMIEKGYDTNVAFATALGCSRNIVGKVLKGEMRPSVTLMDKMINVLDMDPETAGSVFFARNLRVA